MRILTILALSGVFAATIATAESDDSLARDGEALFRKCRGCHQIGAGAVNRVGPVLTGVVGRPVGGVETYDYSDAFRKRAEDGEIWTEQALHGFLEDPRAWVKGAKMSFGGLKNKADRDAIIAYLKAASR